MDKNNHIRFAGRASVAAAAILWVLTGPGATGPAAADPGDTVTIDPTIPPGFFFELESPPESLKGVPIWNELEQILDNPYAIQYADPRLAEELNGFPAYESTIPRRKSFLPPGCSYQVPVPEGLVACDDSLLEPFLVHPLNYDQMTGEEQRMLNPDYPGGPFNVPGELVQCGMGNPNESPFCAVETTANSFNGPVVSPANDPNRWVWVYETVEVSPGEDRVEESAIDFNSPVRPDIATPYTSYPPSFDSLVCIVTTEATPPEGAVICGGDPGEPGYAGFGVYDAEGYSTPAVRGVASPTDPIPLPVAGNFRLFDPAGCAERNMTLGGAGSCMQNGFLTRLMKPTIRPTPWADPQYLANSVANLDGNEDALASSNENDYVRNRDAAIVLGKALFWDMQVGSDGVQSCASCHFSGGADDRTRNQVNPNHIGGDLTFQVAQPNEEVEATDFPFATLENEVFNDTVSSMGVHWGVFADIPPIGTWVVNASGVNVLPPDERVPVDLSDPDTVDPIPGFAGSTGNEFRRVEPRNTPTMITAAFNFDNFWDGRARHDFNGGSVFGPSDPGYHVFVNSGLGGGSGNRIVATRQIVRNSSAASQATGPVLSEFEMSFFGRNWPKVGKKLLQDGVTPLANQLVDITDSVLGIYSNQGGSACAALPAADQSASWSAAGVPGRPGLCINYPALTRMAFYPALWQNPGGGGPDRHLDGAPGADPFDGYVLTPAPGQADPADTDQFTLAEANMSLFFGISVQLWETILIPDNAPFDQFMDANPDAFKSLGEANEPGLVWDMPSCAQSGGVQPCFTEVGPFRRTPGVALNLETGPGVTDGTHAAGEPDPLLGFDFFYGFNLSGKNPEFRTARCGECHAGGNTTDHTMTISNQLGIGDFVGEFSIPGVEVPIEPLGRGRLISGFHLEGELGENAQDAVERRIINQSIFPNPADGLSYPDGSAFFDNGMYNLGVIPCPADYQAPTGYCNDMGRGDNDPFGWPLSLAKLMLWNLAGVGQQPGVVLPNFDPALGTTGGLFEENAQDQQINPGHEEEPADPMLPPYLAPWVSNVPVGDEVQQDEVGGGGAGMVNTFMSTPLLEGLVDTLGPFNPAGTIGENYNMAPEALMGTWPVVNRVGFIGSFKAPSIRNVELTGPYFHNGGKLTLGQVIGFYETGGDFPLTNATHRDFNIVTLRQDVQALGGLGPATQDEFLRSLVDFLLNFTDDRVRNEQAPFDHPEVFVPLDGTAPENNFGRPTFVDLSTTTCAGLAPGAGETTCFQHVQAVGAGGVGPLGLPPVDGFLGVVVGDRNAPNCSIAGGPISHYCTLITP